MDPRRRSVMQPAIDPLANARSHIPLPATVKKPPPNMRLSLAGPALRPPTLSVPGTNPRNSVMRSQNNPLLQSTSKPNYGRTPMSNSVRRGSLWGGGAPAAPPSNSQTMKDTRPLRDKAFQSKMRQDVLAYLTNSGFDISMATLANIQGKDYRAIFETLVLTLDPFFPFRENARLEEDFVPALKSLRYPFATSIDQKWLAAVASPHSWPYLLGVLHWLVELCKIRNEYLCSGHPTIQDPNNVPEEFDDSFDHKAIAFQYIEDIYDQWLDMQNEFPESNRAMEERYDKKNQRVQAELDEQNKRLGQLKTEYHNLQANAPDLAALEKDNRLFLKDSVKWQTILPKNEEKARKVIEQIALEKDDLEKRGQLLEQLKLRLEGLNETVKTQNLSPEQVVGMRTQKETLTRNVEDLKEKISEISRLVLSLEVSITNRVAATEDAIDTYMNMLSSLDLFPPLPEPWHETDLTLELNSATSNLQQLLSGVDIKKIVKPTLSGIAETKRVERAAIESERIKVDNELDQLITECENLDYEIAEVEKKVVNLNEEADDLRDAAQQQALEASSQAARLERDLAQARNAAMANGLGVKTRLHALQFSYKEQIEKVNRLKEETVRAILKNSQEIALFKQEVSRHLQELREFAETE